MRLGRHGGVRAKRPRGSDVPAPVPATGLSSQSCHASPHQVQRLFDPKSQAFRATAGGDGIRELAVAVPRAVDRVGDEEQEDDERDRHAASAASCRRDRRTDSLGPPPVLVRHCEIRDPATTAPAARRPIANHSPARSRSS